MPSFPVESTKTGAASGATRAPRILPMKQLSSTLKPATFAPIQITLLAVLTLWPAPEPNAVLLLPVVLKAERHATDSCVVDSARVAG